MKKYLFILIFGLVRLLNAQVNVSLPDTSAEYNTKILIPVYVSDVTGLGITSYNFKVKFDGNIIDAKNYILDGTISNAFTWSFSKIIRKNSIEIEASGIFPLSGSGVLIYLKFEVVARKGQTGLTFDSFTFNDGQPEAILTNGSFYVYRPVTLTIDKEGNGSGIVYVDSIQVNLPYQATFNQDDVVTLEAFPDNNSQFDYWSGDIQTNENPVPVVLDNDKNIIANFSIITFNISTSSQPPEGGQTNGGGVYNIGENVTVSAVANQYWQFESWTENGNVVSDEPSYSFIAINDRDLVANFRHLTYSVNTTADPPEGGNTSGDGVYNAGSQVTVTASPNAGWKFLSWKENNRIVSTSPAYRFTIENNRNLTAKFKEETYAVNATPVPQNGGTITGTGNYNYGDEVTLSAIPNSGWYFVNWQENGDIVSTERTISFNVDSDRNFLANFSDQVLSVECSAQPSDGGTVSGCGFFHLNQTAVLIAVPNPGWSFNNWTLNNTVISDNDTLMFDVQSNVTVIANFEKDTYTINCYSNPIDGGVTSGCGFFNYGQTAQLKAIPNPGFEFSYWSENDSSISDSSELSFPVNGSRNLIANFNPVTGLNDLTSENIIPQKYFLANAYPNPFNPSTLIKFGVPENSNVNIKIFNLQGKMVSSLIENRNFGPGVYLKRFTARNLASGIYLIVFKAFGINKNKLFIDSQKLVLLK